MHVHVSAQASTHTQAGTQALLHFPLAADGFRVCTDVAATPHRTAVADTTSAPNGPQHPTSLISILATFLATVMASILASILALSALTFH